LDKKNAETNEKIVLPCGCVYHDKSWLIERVVECDFHKHSRTAKRPYRPKAECVRP
jgi:hypothetical protein